jgi:hypothetical protein
MERQQRRTACMEKCLSIGQYKPERKAVHFEEVWYDGYAFDEANRKLTDIATERVDIDNATKLLRKRKPSTCL